MLVYDKAKYHDESVEEEGLPHEHADHHIVYFLRWLIENDLVSREMTKGGAGRALKAYRSGRQSIFWLFEWWDRCFVSDMVSAEARPFVDSYFDYQHGQYLADYDSVLVGELPSFFHVTYTDASYRLLAARVSARWDDFRTAAR
ncbi:hypothetical protein Cch01nite_03170 [Cellulomonas chitinilytica]|uniref:DUF7832 domain-containing protein n=1 Tax=Cellulomonas chitinilytica TaxID=398759 RepID=A0A919NXV4_9CELL|nr:hypothetical protein [Cellulomonas chitinilytica]GIG19593.1 hypothetical protein Cch01nite_03170 [Cellulomonas chitinilytica]